jgi:hypothetical protein
MQNEYIGWSPCPSNCAERYASEAGAEGLNQHKIDEQGADA